MSIQRKAGNRAATAFVRNRAGGGHAPPARAASDGATLSVQRGEAGVHQDIELTATGTARPTHLGRGLQHGIDMTPDQRRAMEMYSGNWMRDFSQFLVPTALNAISQVPRRPEPGAPAIGGAGAEQLIVGLLRALASIEFGPEITDRLMTGPNIGTYRPEEHMDNPAGMSLGGDVLVRGDSGALRPARAGDRESPQLSGSAVAGPQVENAELFPVSSQGLSRHIYNTTEHVKGRLLQAFQLGPTPEGRMQVGAGLHGVEDYFSHSNFIEVALNMLLSERRHQGVRRQVSGAPATGPVVDTMYDVTVGQGASSRQAVTTGTFTARDTQVSIAHVLLPRLPTLFTGIDRAIDRSLLALRAGGSTWAQVKEQLRTDRAGAAFTYLLDGMDAANMELPSARIDKWQIPDLPGILPDQIENTLEGRWIPTGITPLSLPPSRAIPSYQALYRDAQEIWQYRDELRTMLQSLLPLVSSIVALRDRIRAAIQALSQSIDQLIANHIQQLKQQVRQHLFDTIERLTGINVPAEKRRTLEQWVAAIQHGAEDLTHATSLEHQLRAGDLQVPAGERGNRLPAGAIGPDGSVSGSVLPPSHSEISKDHPDHRSHGGPEGADAEPGHGHVHGANLESAFFEVHRDLAVTADRHMVGLMEEAWAARGYADPQINRGSGRATLAQAERRARDRQASDVAGRSATMAQADRRRFAQSAEDTPAAMMATLNAVDLYIAHPADSTWWRPIIEQHFDGARLQELLEGIEARNSMRGRRAAWDPVGAATGRP